MLQAKKIWGDNEDRCSKTRRGNKRSGKGTKTSQLSRNSFLDQLSITKMCSNMLGIFISVLFVQVLDMMPLYDLFKVQLYNLYIMLKN